MPVCLPETVSTGRRIAGKDFIGRLGAEKAIGDWGKWGAGFSYYHGFVYNPTTEAYEMRGNHFVKRDMGETGTYMKRQYLGLDGQFSFFHL